MRVQGLRLQGVWVQEGGRQVTEATKPQWHVETDYPLAFDSLDFLEPWGTARDSFTNQHYCWFVARLAAPSPDLPIRVADLGCAGGGLVADFLRLGHFAVGLEGSDHNRKTQRAEWPRIPDHLFTCDISRPFQILFNGEKAELDLATAWDVLEHIDEDRLPVLLKTIHAHLRVGGLFHATIPPQNDEPVQDRYHATMKPRTWWDAMFLAHGFVVDEPSLELLRVHRPRGEAWMAHGYRKTDRKVG